MKALRAITLLHSLSAALSLTGCSQPLDLRTKPTQQQLPTAAQVLRYYPSQSLPASSGHSPALYDLVVIDPRWVNLSFSSGWEQEMYASQDKSAILYISGPTFEISSTAENGAVPQGDLWLAGRLIISGNRAAARKRAYLAISKTGSLLIGYGAYDPQQHSHLRSLIGGLHVLYDSRGKPPEQYKGVYSSISLADIRLVYGLRYDGLLEILETKDGMTASRLLDLVRHRAYRAALLPDHASKSRLILPGIRIWSSSHAHWISGGRPAITAMPYLLRVTLDPRIKGSAIRINSVKPP